MAIVDAAEDIVRLRRQAINDPKLPMSDRLAAARDLENRSLGKPTERVEHAVELPRSRAELEALTDAELDELIAQHELANGLPQLQEAAEDAEWTEGSLLPE